MTSVGGECTVSDSPVVAGHSTGGNVSNDAMCEVRTCNSKAVWHIQFVTIWDGPNYCVLNLCTRHKGVVTPSTMDRIR